MITQDNIATGVLYNDFSPLQIGLNIGAGASILIATAQGLWAGGQSAAVGSGGSAIPMTLISFESNSIFENTAVWYLLNPPSGNKQINIFTGSSGNIMSGVAASYFGAGGVRAYSSDKNTNLNSGTTYTLTPVSQLNDLVIHIIGNQASPGNLFGSPPTLTYATGETEEAQQLINQDSRSMINYADKAGANGTTTVSFQSNFFGSNIFYETIAFALTPSTLPVGMFLVSD